MLALRKRIINKAVIAIAPDRVPSICITSMDLSDYMIWGQEKLENYVEAYDCRPPPFMIPLIILSQVSPNHDNVINLENAIKFPFLCH